jgi:biopolymer transport protein ExbD
MRTRYEHGVHESSHGIDLAPMLDFVVNLLIFFIVAAVFVKESAISMRRPTDADTATQSLAAIIEIQGDGEIVLEGRAIDLRSVRANVETLLANDRKSISIIAQENAPTGVVVAVVDEIHLGGIYDITFSTVPLIAPVAPVASVK